MQITLRFTRTAKRERPDDELRKLLRKGRQYINHLRPPHHCLLSFLDFYSRLLLFKGEFPAFRNLIRVKQLIFIFYTLLFQLVTLFLKLEASILLLLTDVV